MSRVASQDVALMRAFAGYRGCPERTARYHRQHQTAEWVAFVTSYAGERVTLEMAPAASAGTGAADGTNGDASGARPPGMGAAGMTIVDQELPAALDRAVQVEIEAWNTCIVCKEQKRIAQANRKPDLVAAWIKCEAEAAKNHREALRHRVQLEQQEGRLVPVSEIDRIRTEFLEPVRDLLRTMPAELGPEANPVFPEIGMDAVKAWLKRRLDPALRGLARALPKGEARSVTAPTEAAAETNGSMAGGSNTGTGSEAVSYEL